MVDPGSLNVCRFLPVQLVDLPAIIESHKTIDNKVLYKTGDIAQMMVCSQDAQEDQLEEEKVNVAEMTAAKKKELYKKFVCNHGGEQPAL